MSTAPKLFAFDLDDTLAPSKSPLEPRMVAALSSLLRHVPVAIISGGAFGQFRTQVVDRLTSLDSEMLGRLHLLPTCGTQYYVHRADGWQRVYAETLTPEQISAAWTALEEEARRLGLWESHTWGPILEDRGSQVTFSALGQSAPVDAKAAWDPDGSKKAALRDAAASRLPDLEVRSGGSTSVDVTRRGIDKAYGMRRLVDITGIAAGDVMFVGDRLDEGGNDFPVIATGVRTHAVTGWEETAAFLEGLCLA